MKKYLSFCLPVLLCCMLISNVAISQLQKIYLHPKAAGSGKQSQFVDSIRFIPLEIKEGIQMGKYSNVVVTEKYFLTTDYAEKVMLLYSKNGSFVKKISYKKLGDNFYPDYDKHNNRIVFFGSNKNYNLTPKDRIKIMLDWNNPGNKKYFKKYFIDLGETSFALQKDIPNENDIISAKHFYDDFYCNVLITTSPLYKDSLDYEFKIYKNKQLVKGFFPYNRINEPKYLYIGGANVGIQKTDGQYAHILTRPYCDTIYKMIKDSLFPIYQVVLPLENSLPPTFFTKPFKNKTDRDNFHRNNGWMLRQVYGFEETPKFIYFSVGYLSNFESYIYQKQTNITYKTKNIKADSSQYNMQLLADSYSLSQNGGRSYKLQKAGDLITFFEQNKNVAIPKELENYLKGNPPSAAPIIVEFKLKN